MKIVSLVCTALLALGADWQRVEPGREWAFPRDHYAHRDYRTEWWYFTGHLVDSDDPTRRFGYQFTIFSIGLGEPGEGRWNSGRALMGHAAITDERAGEHRFSELLHRETGFLARFGEPGQSVLAESAGPAGTRERWRLTLDGERFTLRMADRREGFAFELVATPERPMTFHGVDGYSPKSEREGAASHYYSFTRLATRGSVTIDGRRLEVEGRSWMDKEFSSTHLEPEQSGWDWFSLQLDDGRDLMLFRLRDEAGESDFVEGTRVDAAGASRLERPRMAPGRRWNGYPVEWELTVDGERLRLEPTLDDQENVGRGFGVRYWEGSVRVLDAEGRVVGRGFVEMTGYGDDARPPI